MNSLIVFDLDDTLYPESQFVLSGFEAADQKFFELTQTRGFLKQATAYFEKGARGTIFDSVIADLTPQWKNPKDLVAELLKAYRTHPPKIQLFEDAEWILNELQNSRPLGLLTDGYHETQRNKVRALGLETRIPHIVYSDALGRENWKPSPAPFKKMMEISGVSQDQGQLCLYIADNPTKDFIGPKSLGWRTIRIKRTTGEYAHLEVEISKDADLTAKDFYELKRLL